METQAALYLEAFARKLVGSKALRKGAIVFRLGGPDGGDYWLDCSAKGVRVVRGTPRGTPRVEVIGEARRIRAILEGEKDARAQFLAGGFRIRGDMPYLSRLAVALGIIEQPFVVETRRRR